MERWNYHVNNNFVVVKNTRKTDKLVDLEITDFKKNNFVFLQWLISLYFFCWKNNIIFSNIQFIIKIN